MSGPMRRKHPPKNEIELLDAEIFEVPRRLSLDDARDQMGPVRGGGFSTDDEIRDDR